jgi:transcriptional regulator with XRE-family HTH domain
VSEARGRRAGGRKRGSARGAGSPATADRERADEAPERGGDGDLDGELARIGQRVRRWREERHFTLQELARRSGLATSTVHKVESAQMIPSVAVLLKLARGLGRRPAELVHDESAAAELAHRPAGARTSVGVEGQLVVERLSGDLLDPALEAWRVTVHPGVSGGEDVRYEGEELVWVEEGEVTFRVDGRDVVLGAGDGLHFKARMPHGWRNASDAPARFVVVGTLPRELRAALQGRVAGLSRDR